jgi:hypothetical protein
LTPTTALLSQRREVNDVGRGLDISALVDQRLHRFHAVVIGGKHQRGFAARRFLCIRIGAFLEEQLYRIGSAGRRREHERGRPVGRRCERVGAGLDQQLQHCRIANLRGHDERRVGAQTS